MFLSVMLFTLFKLLFFFLNEVADSLKWDLKFFENTGKLLNPHLYAMSEIESFPWINNDAAFSNRSRRINWNGVSLVMPWNILLKWNFEKLEISAKLFNEKSLSKFFSIWSITLLILYLYSLSIIQIVQTCTTEPRYSPWLGTF